MNRDAIFLNHILTRCRKIIAVTSEISYEEFAGNPDIQDVIIRSFEIIGEAVTHLSEECKSGHPEIPWREMKQFRNVLIHQYFRLDLKQIWAVSCHDISEIAVLVERMLN